ncbi:MAG: divergent polysaccharide deacetylase family protein [Deltaproteobacteria bacterium]|nr:divergent polysaccharide deacetylase family protein [Deltaproteobacteria bacterium]
MARSGRKTARKKGKKRKPYLYLLVSLGVIGLLAILLFLLPKSAEKKVVQPIPPAPSPAAKLPEEPKREKESPPAPISRLALIIDDGGYNVDKIKGIMEIGRPLTLSILPNTPHARKTALLAHQEGAEIMLHLPMEPKESERFPLEKDTVLSGMDNHEIQAILRMGLKEIPHVRGVNNHMGSKATEDTRVMKALMEILKKEGLYYVDSHTSSRTVGPRAARQAGVAFGSNDRFIDQEKDLEAIKKSIRLAMKKAKQEGKAIAIGHPHPLTARAIREMIPEIEGAGIKLVFASEVVG